MTVSRERTARRLALATLGYTVFVILWGVVVRATGAGAGCGASWPTCNGEVIPMNPSLNTLIEFGHRVTSGIALPLVIWMAVAVWRAFPKGSGARKAAGASVFFMLLEAAIGAGLVLLEYVAFDARIGRAIWIAAHLLNTFLLLGALTLAVWTAYGHSLPRWPRGGGPAATTRAWAILIALVGTMVLGASGAITALGDTLVLRGGLSPEENAVVAVLVSLRLLHPTIAFIVLALVGWAAWASRDTAARKLGIGVTALFVMQMGLGALNVWLLAPLWMQVVHLLVTDIIWIGLILLAARALAPDLAAVRETRQPVAA
ncbi:MAG: COX15/CtaA family protein [Bacteroidota bacterium]